MAAIAARSVLRSARLGTTRFAKPTKSPSSPFLLPKQKPPSSFTSRIPVEMSCAMDSMLPFHTATASALLTSMLSVTPRIYYLTIEENEICKFLKLKPPYDNELKILEIPS